jgi:hypothetical protein
MWIEVWALKAGFRFIFDRRVCGFEFLTVD